MTAQDRPKTAQDRPKTTPRRRKTAPRPSQDRQRPPQYHSRPPKTGPRPRQDRPKTASRMPTKPQSLQAFRLPSTNRRGAGGRGVAFISGRFPWNGLCEIIIHRNIIHSKNVKCDFFEIFCTSVRKVQGDGPRLCRRPRIQANQDRLKIDQKSM